MKFSENLNLPILQDGDKYSKEIQNEAFNTIDKECTNIKNTIKSVLDINDDVTDAIKTLGDISEELSDLKEKQNEDYYELLESNNYIGEKIRDINSQLETMVSKYDSFIYANNPPKGLIPLSEENEDNTIIFDNILKYAKEHKKSVYIKKGIYKLKYINMYDKVSLFGEGKGKTIFLATSSDELNFMRTVDLVVSQATYKDFSLWGGVDRDNINNPIKNMLCLISQNGGSSGNGTWYCNFESIEITHFNGIGILIEDNYNDAKHPNQFNNFTDIQVFRSNGDGKCLSIKGQCAQHFFSNCSFDNNGRNPGVGNLSNFRDGLGVNIDIDGGNLITFENITSQNSSNIANLVNCRNITFKNCWFENSKKCITIDNGIGVNIEKSNFANVCSDDLGSGYGIKITGSNSCVNIEDNTFVGTIDYMVMSNGNVSHIICKNNNGTNKTKGIVKQRTSSDGTFSIGGAKLIQFINANGTISNLTSTHSVGEIFTILFGGGGTTTLNNSGNIEFPNGKTSLTFKNVDSATFMKSDLASGKEYILIGFTGV